MINGKGRLQRLNRAVRGPGQARDDWEILRDLIQAVFGPERHLLDRRCLPANERIDPAIRRIELEQDRRSRRAGDGGMASPTPANLPGRMKNPNRTRLVIRHGLLFPHFIVGQDRRASRRRPRHHELRRLCGAPDQRVDPGPARTKSRRPRRLVSTDRRRREISPERRLHARRT